MSEYNKNIFLGFAACAPRFIPEWLYTKLFCPPLEEGPDGRVLHGHCGQRKIEAALLNNGFAKEDVVVANPQSLGKVIDEETKVLCITTHDPLGLGPASTTFSDLTGRETFTSIFFKKLCSEPSIRKYQVKVLVGGSGAWQLTDERIMAKLGIDCVVLGEGEKTAVTLIKKAINNEPLPAFMQGDVVPLDEIPVIKDPTINGIIEITRGCGRGCRFCNPTMLNFRCISLDRILQEARINVGAGNGVLLHGEDVLRYKARGFTPNEEAVVELFTQMKALTDNVGISHFSHASAMSNPRLIERISEIMEVGSKVCPFFSGQVGIETGSVRIIEKFMKGKAKPFKPEEWPEMIRDSHELLHQNHWVPAETLIIGLPGETPEDIDKTTELIQDISPYRSLIVPLFFVPLGNLTGSGFFKTKNIKENHWRLIAACMNHNFKWVYQLADENLPVVGMGPLKQFIIRNIVKYMDKRLRPYLKLMEEGINPIYHGNNGKTRSYSSANSTQYQIEFPPLENNYSNR